MTPNKDSLPYRSCVGIMLVNDTGHVLVAQRRDLPGDSWQMPQGGIDDGETPAQAALRELREEIGTVKAEILAETTEWYAYDLPDDLIGKAWGGRYRGQEQKWVLAKFKGSDADIQIETEHPEFVAWKWAPLEQLTTLIVPFKRKVYRQVVAEFQPIVNECRGAVGGK
ncbi:MAG: RNA pyrophosphohydrolase [Alphaproteobacteria bacterium]|nr:RNA pyrophosphohydrolase [Alphaproteobacteria bacterium]